MKKSPSNTLGSASTPAISSASKRRREYAVSPEQSELILQIKNLITATAHKLIAMGEKIPMAVSTSVPSIQSTESISYRKTFASYTERVHTAPVFKVGRCVSIMTLEPLVSNEYISSIV